MLQQGIAAAKAGDKDQAREILQNVLEQDPKNEPAWWWLASVLDKDDAIICLKNVLKLNPGNEKAQAALTGNIVIVRTILFISGGAVFLGIVLFLGGLIQYISTWGPD